MWSNCCGVDEVLKVYPWVVVSFATYCILSVGCGILCVFVVVVVLWFAVRCGELQVLIDGCIHCENEAHESIDHEPVSGETLLLLLLLLLPEEEKP